jgi:hypothetical protein
VRVDERDCVRDPIDDRRCIGHECHACPPAGRCSICGELVPDAELFAHQERHLRPEVGPVASAAIDVAADVSMGARPEGIAGRLAALVELVDVTASEVADRPDLTADERARIAADLRIARHALAVALDDAAPPD